MKYGYWLLLIGAVLAACDTNRSVAAAAPATITAPETPAFPQNYVGTWRGELEVWLPGRGRVQALPMELVIQSLTDTSYTYTIIYGEDREAGKRPYELVVHDAAKGLYFIDERNGIGLEAYLVGEVFVQRFEVMGNLLTTQTRIREDGTLLWEIFSGPLDPVSRSGDTVTNGDTIPPVTAYGVGNYQRAVLRRGDE